MLALSSQIKEKSHEGDIPALLSLHLFCLNHGVKDQSTLAIILDITLHNLRPELHPRLDGVLQFPRASRAWLKSVAICLSALVEGMDSFKTPPAKPFQKLTQHWLSHIWPCVSILTEWYILDELQCPVSPHIHQETLNTTISALFNHLSQPKIGILAQMRRTKGMPLCAIRLLVQALDWHPHPSSVYLENLTGYIHEEAHENADGEMLKFVIAELENNTRFIPGLLGYLPRKTKEMNERADDMLWVLTLAGTVFQGSTQLTRKVATKYPALLNRLVKILHHFILVLSYRNQMTDSQFKLKSLYLLTFLAGVISEITVTGGSRAQRQVLKRGLLHAILKIESIGPMDDASQEIVRGFTFNLTAIAPALSHYSILARVLYDLKKIKDQSLDDALMSSTNSEVYSLQKEWSRFRDLAMARVPVMNEYNEFILRGAPFCSAPTCPRDTKNDTRRCSVCKLAYYCSKRCQKKHSVEHKSSCKPPRSEALKIDDRDMDFLEYQLNYDMQHNWSKVNVKFDTRPNTVKYLYCDLQVFPPTIKVLPAHLNIMVRMCHEEAGLPPDSDLVWIFIGLKIRDVKSRILYARAPESLVKAALKGGRVKRRKGERLVRLEDEGMMPFTEEQMYAVLKAGM